MSSSCPKCLSFSELEFVSLLAALHDCFPPPYRQRRFVSPLPPHFLCASGAFSGISFLFFEEYNVFFLPLLLRSLVESQVKERAQPITITTLFSIVLAYRDQEALFWCPAVEVDQRVPSPYCNEPFSFAEGSQGAPVPLA